MMIREEQRGVLGTGALWFYVPRDARLVRDTAEARL